MGFSSVLLQLFGLPLLDFDLLGFSSLAFRSVGLQLSGFQPFHSWDLLGFTSLRCSSVGLQLSGLQLFWIWICWASRLFASDRCASPLWDLSLLCLGSLASGLSGFSSLDFSPIGQREWQEEIRRQQQARDAWYLQMGLPHQAVAPLTMRLRAPLSLILGISPAAA